ncbi:hypothetical protein D3C75_957540 [compost metagenome]
MCIHVCECLGAVNDSIGAVGQAVDFGIGFSANNSNCRRHMGEAAVRIEDNARRNFAGIRSAGYGNGSFHIAVEFGNVHGIAAADSCDLELHRLCSKLVTLLLNSVHHLIYRIRCRRCYCDLDFDIL